VEATFRPSLNIVASSKIAGKEEKSNGLELFMAIMMIITPSKILKVNKKSNKNGGSGRINIEIMSSTITGIPSPESSIFDTS
jgi:hypothetical protein